MNYHRANEQCTMHRILVVFTLLLPYVGGTAIFDHGQCNYIYNAGCYLSHNNAAKGKFEAAKNLCSVDDLIDNVKFILQLFPKDNSTSSGVTKVNFTLPNVECKYKVALLVNSFIKNDKDCKNHAFSNTDSNEEEIHTVENNVCVVPFSDRNSLNNCEKNTFSMWYEHIFTGCYALRFTVDGYKYSVLGNKYLTTDYIRTEVSEPRFRCRYEDRIEAETSKREPVTFLLSVSVQADTVGVNLTLSPISHLEENEVIDCVRNCKEPLAAWHLIMGEKTDRPLKNCTQRAGEEINSRDIDCEFSLQAPHEAGYCLKIELEDERCHRNTIWNPPPDNKDDEQSCIWLQSCSGIVKKIPPVNPESAVETSRLSQIIIIVTIISIVVGITIFFICRTYYRNKGPIYHNSNLKNLKISENGMEIENVESTDDENALKSSIIAYGDDKEEIEPIVFLYARGTSSFMKFMSEFRNILKTRCHCRIRDWYDAREWDEVARIGPSTWVADLLRDRHRAVWIDTPKARKLFGGRRNNFFDDSGENIFEDDNAEEEEVVSDFRDAALPIVLEMAERNATSSGYNKHFIVRLEGFHGNDGTDEDPFENLSPYTRYLIPRHLSELCSHLSSSSMKVDCRESLKANQALLKESLLRMENNLPILQN